MTTRLPALVAVSVLWLGLAGTVVAAEDAAAIHLDVYKSPTCGCCVKWMDHLAQSGFSTTAHIGTLDQDFGVPARYGSCHTGVSEQGFVFEGHVPARYVRQFLEDPPEGALGLSVPAMPVGSPGMEYRNEFNPYDVLLLKKDGTVEVYASVATYAQQFE